MAEVISVRFRGASKNYYFDPRGLQVRPDDYVVVETAQGIEYAKCAEGNHEVPDEAVVQPLRPVVRLATENDHKAAAYNRKREKEAFGICEQKIAAHGLEMKLVRVECSFEGNKIVFFFTADGRVDFRELVKDLASVFRARIELRQIGVRDEAKMLGGLGICGRPLCCSQFLSEFIPVSIKMAKTQNLSLNPAKISGTCGRLMCCLKYEQTAYEDASKRMPKNESFVDTPDGVGNVCAVNLLQEEVQVRLDSAPDSPKRYKSAEIRVLRNGKGSREGIEIPAERPARVTFAEPASPDAPRRRRPDMPPIQISSALSEAPAPETEENTDGGRHRRAKGRGGRPKTAAPPERAARPDKSPTADRVEKIPVRSTSETSAEKKAAADRAADQAAKLDKDPAKGGGNRRRFRRRPKNK